MTLASCSGTCCTDDDDDEVEEDVEDDMSSDLAYKFIAMAGNRFRVDEFVKIKDKVDLDELMVVNGERNGSVE